MIEGLSVWDCLRHGKAAFGRSIVAQLIELVRLRMAHQRLGIEEYFLFNLNDGRALSFEEKTRFVGWRKLREIESRCIPKDWWAVVEDKLVLYSLLHALDLPIPRISGLYHPFRRFPGAELLRTEDELVSFLRSNCTRPLFGKPNTTGRGIGLTMIESYEESTDSLLLLDGTRIGGEAFAKRLRPHYNGGYVFQDVLEPHADLANITAGRVCTVRLIVLVNPSGPELLCGMIRMAVGSNPGDNYSVPGNLVGGLEIESGRVSRMITGIGPRMKQVSHHPDSGLPVEGITLPDWNAVTSTCHECAAVAPGVRIQGWDFALTNRGPVALEANAGSDPRGLQLGNGRGLLGDKLLDFVATCSAR